MPRPFCYAALLLLLVVPARAQWSQTAGPEGARIIALAGLSETEVRAATSGGGIHRWDGAGWARVGSLPQIQAFHARDEVLFASTHEDAFRSADGGATWEALGFEAPVTAFAEYDGALYVAARDSVYRTVDGGDTWALAIADYEILTDLFGEPTWQTIVEPRALAVHAGHVILGATTSVYPLPATLFRTPLDSAAWERSEEGLPNVRANEIVVRDGDLWAATDRGAFSSPDGGLSWQDRNAGLETWPSVSQFVEAHGAFYAVSRGGLSRWSGAAWEPVAGLGEAVLAAAVGDAVVVATPMDLLRSPDGTTWTSIGSGLVATWATPYELSEGFVAAIDGFTGRGFRTDDGGASWSHMAGLAPRRFLRHGGEAFAATEDGVMRSTDGGATWVPANGGIAYAVFHSRAFAAASSDGTTAFLGFASLRARKHLPAEYWGGVYRSDGRGGWTAANAGLPRETGEPARIRALFNRDGVVLAALVNPSLGAYRSADDGAHWEPMGSGWPQNAYVYAFESAGEAIVALTSAGAFAASDGGASWADVSAGLPPAPFFGHLLALDDALFAIGPEGPAHHVWRFEGAGWERTDLALPPEVATWTGFAAHAGAVYAGTADAGVWTVPASFFLPVVAGEPGAAPQAAALSAPRPNPLRGEAALVLRLPQRQPVTVAVYDALGREVARLHDGPLEAGTHRLRWRAAGLSAGLYLVRATGPDLRLTQKATVIR